MSYFIIKWIKFNEDKTEIKVYWSNNNETPKNYQWGSFMSLWEFLAKYSGGIIQYPLEQIWSNELTTLDELFYEFVNKTTKDSSLFYEMYYWNNGDKEQYEKYVIDFFKEYFDKVSKRYIVQYKKIDKVSEVLWVQEQETILEFSINKNKFELTSAWYWMKLSYWQMKRLLGHIKNEKELIIKEI